MKIPIVGEKAKERWLKERTPTTGYSLAFATRLIKEEIAKICDFNLKQKQLKKFNKNCCAKNTETTIMNFGCPDNVFRKQK